MLTIDHGNFELSEKIATTNKTQRLKSPRKQWFVFCFLLDEKPRACGRDKRKRYLVAFMVVGGLILIYVQK